MANLQKIKTIAKERGISLVSICKNVGVTEQGLQKMIKNNTTTIDTIERIADYLNVPITTFFDEAETINVSATAHGNNSCAVAGEGNTIAISQDFLEIIREKDKLIMEKDQLIQSLTLRLLAK